MARPRKYFYFPFTNWNRTAKDFQVGDTVRMADEFAGLRQITYTLYTVVKIHPRKNGVTVTKVA